MRKGLTEIVFILDRSGSMSGLEADTIGGFNSLIGRQRKEEGDALVSTILFDDTSEVLHNRLPLCYIEPMSEKQYYVRGCTALLDAIGGAIDHMVQVRRMEEPERTPEKTIFIITTDGMENASCRYTFDRVKEMIQRQKMQYGWEFLFLGANMDAVEVAGRFGIDGDRAATYHCDREGTALNYEVLSDAISEVRSCRPLSADWKKRIDEDFERRK
ncbi:MAG: hypothetical protein ACI4LA_01755 [Emergencia sp.]